MNAPATVTPSDLRALHEITLRRVQQAADTWYLKVSADPERPNPRITALLAELESLLVPGDGDEFAARLGVHRGH